MAEVMNMPVDSLEPRGDREEKSADDPQSLSPPPPPAPAPSKQRFRRDDRDSDRPPNRRGDYYDRSKSPMAPPPLRERQRNRDRDYKRRSSISPPPPPYRDRRHSPPPPYKRSRREDGGYGGRRGGFGPGDRRFGYDYGGGYEREMGGRGYGDERPHGRYVGHSFGPPEWDSGRGGFGEASGMGNTQREGLMSYKQFIQELEDDILPSEAERRYQEYKSEYISTQKQAYFSAHKDEGWFKDKYHPTNLLTVVERRNELARKLAKDFLLDLQSGTLDLGPGINASSSNKSGRASDPNSEDEGDGGKRKWHGSTPTSGTDLSAAPKAHRVSTDPRRIQVDIEQAQDLVCKLDSEKQIEENILCGSDNDKMNREKSHAGSTGPVIIIRGLKSIKGLEGVELLDTLITYLWRIHGLDYYGMIEKSECKGLRHVRVEGKSFDIASNGEEWEKKLDSHWQERLQSPDPMEVMTAKEKIDAAAAEALDPHVRKIRDEKYGWKYGCGAKSCTKLFHAADFVRKHLKLKHPELVMELTVKVREELYFQNYMNDADAPGGTPVMQQSGLRDRVQRRRFGADTRLKDDRGNRRDGDNLASGSERFDNLRPGEFQSNSDGSDGGNLDNTMYDAFGEQGLHVGPPFPSDISTPPVLMPVPGAGPLGPFVPAPPEVAMRMLREQGGPPPFEVDGRNSQSEPQLSGPTPMLALSPALQQDPRRLRSYQDLDAPEDEVTVIDYRSL